jgi:hypothetical protein
VRQRCAKGFNSGFKWLIDISSVAAFALSSVFSFPKLSKKEELGVRAKYPAGGGVSSVERS